MAPRQPKKIKVSENTGDKTAKRAAKEALATKLGHLAFKIGKQQRRTEMEMQKLQALQKEANELASEMERLEAELNE